MVSKQEMQSGPPHNGSTYKSMPHMSKNVEVYKVGPTATRPGPKIHR